MSSVAARALAFVSLFGRDRTRRGHAQRERATPPARSTGGGAAASWPRRWVRARFVASPGPQRAVEASTSVGAVVAAAGVAGGRGVAALDRRCFLEDLDPPLSSADRCFRGRSAGVGA